VLLYRRNSVFAGLVLFMIGLLVACQTTPALVTPSAPGISVGIADDLCPSAIVQVGQHITWTNQGNQEHIVRDKSIEGTRRFDSGILKAGDAFTFSFLKPERYTYDCSVDGVLTGTITVEP
jgi:hypothetical protein